MIPDTRKFEFFEKYRRFAVLIFVMSFGISCAGGMIRVTPDYRGKSLEAESLKVQLFPVDVDPALEPNYAFMAEGDSGNAGYAAFFRENFSKFAGLYSTFQNISFTDDETEFIRVELELEWNETIFFDIPDTSQGTLEPGDEAAYTLFIENLTVSRRKGSDNMIMPTGGTVLILGGDAPHLRHSGRFLIWDGHARKVVSYGKIDLKTKIGPGGFAQTAARAVEEMTQLIFRKSPFERKQ